METIITIITLVISFVSGGALMVLITAKSTRKKASVEVKKEEVSAHEMISNFHRNEIKHLTEQMEELRKEMQKLTESNKELKKQLTRCETCKLRKNENQ